MGFLTDSSTPYHACKPDIRASTWFHRCVWSGVLILFMAGCGSLQFQRPTAISEKDWITEGDTPQRTSYVPYAMKPPLEEVWTYNASAGFGPGSPLIFGQTVLVANRKGEIHGIDLKTGKRLGIGRFGSAIEGTPVYRNGIVYVPVAWGGRALQAYDLARGQVLWSVKHAPVETGLILTEDFVVSVDAEATVRAYGLVDGRINWEVKLGERVSVSASPGLLEGRGIVVADNSGRIVLVRPQDGSIVWTRQLSQPVLNTMAVADDRIYVPTTRGRFLALNGATSEIDWTFETGDTTVYMSTPSIAENTIVFGATDGFLRALDRETGKELWHFEVDEAFSSAPLVAGNMVLAGGLKEKLYALERETGKLVWTGEVKGRIKSGIAATDEYIVVLTEPNLVYLFKPSSSGYVGSH